MERSSLQHAIDRALQLPVQASGYDLHCALERLYPGKFVHFTDDTSFNPADYARAGFCGFELSEEAIPQIERGTVFPSDEFTESPQQLVGRVTWNGRTLTFVQLQVRLPDCGARNLKWVIADSAADAEGFYKVAAKWGDTLHEEVYVFERGFWEQSAELYQAIREFTFDGLILEGTLKEELRSDVRRFLESRALYEEHRIPWKRGLLLVGPPGNGKTHAIKAIANELGLPVLYVKNLKARHQPPEESVREIFSHARRHAPCLLVLEDLDSLLKVGNRSVFLNELDGFAANRGIITVASTNHPERLDASILERPSRFDRKFHFNLPALSERSAYLELWSRGLKPALKLSAETIARLAEETQGFSFAYLKELVVSSLVTWTANPVAGAMDALIVTRTAVLRQQMNSGIAAAELEMTYEDDEEEKS